MLLWAFFLSTHISFYGRFLQDVSAFTATLGSFCAHLSLLKKSSADNLSSSMNAYAEHQYVLC